jgi:NAD(P)H-hydrate epimerase
MEGIVLINVGLQPRLGALPAWRGGGDGPCHGGAAHFGLDRTGRVFEGLVMSVPVVTRAEMRAWEAATWASGQTAEAVIARVGERLAARVMRATGRGDRVLLLAGKGHNGDDTRAAERYLAGREVATVSVADPAEALPAITAALAGRPALVVDGLFGIGLDRPLSVGWAALVAAVNASRRSVLAVDVPSGLNADTGEPMGTAVVAGTTCTVGAPKRGLLAPGAERWTGRIEVEADIGLIAAPAAGELRWTLPAEFAGCPPARPESGHKGTFGHLAVVAGSLGYHGAAVLAVGGAQRAQPGLVTAVTPEAVYGPVAAQLQSAMVRPWESAATWPPGITGIVAGPGLAAARLPAGLREWVVQNWRGSAVPMVVDASALDWLPDGPIPAGAVRVVTPHPGEAARRLRTTAPTIQADRVAAVRAVSRRLGGCWVVLKGRHTLVGRAEGPMYVNPSGNPHLAQGGTGDVLAGYIGGCLCQPDWQRDVVLALRYAVWQHGAAADALAGIDLGAGVGVCGLGRRQRSGPRGTGLALGGETSWTVEDLVAVLGSVRVSGC